MNILVLCTGNSTRSILLESLFNQLSQGRVRAWSAGSHPAGHVHVQTLALLAAESIDTSRLRSKSWDEFASPDAPQMHLVVTVCGNTADETCPIWPGAPLRGHWGVDEPALADLDDQPAAFARTWSILKRRAQAFLDLPFEKMEPAELAQEVTRIGTI